MQTAPDNRRAFMRHDDDVRLRIEKLEPGTCEQIVGELDYWRRRYRLDDGGSGKHASLGAALRRVRSRDPDVAACLVRLEQRIDLLTRQLTGESPEDGDARPVRVNLSAQGLRCLTDTPFEAGDAAEIGMELLPDGEQVALIGRVLRAELDEGSGLADVSVRFEHVLERDQETLIRHVYRLERDSRALGGRAA